MDNIKVYSNVALPFLYANKCPPQFIHPQRKLERFYMSHHMVGLLKQTTFSVLMFLKSFFWLGHCTGSYLPHTLYYLGCILGSDLVHSLQSYLPLGGFVCACMRVFVCVRVCVPGLFNEIYNCDSLVFNSSRLKHP